MRNPVITIDGPAAAGKSTVARMVARKLGLRFLDTGAMYRAVAWKARKLGLADLREIVSLIRDARITVDEDRVTCDGTDISREIRTPEITAAVRPIADSPECRAELVRHQKEIGVEGGLVTEGRDQGSVVFPEAEFKFYLDASIDVRAGRRHREQGGDFAEVRDSLSKRDRDDRLRPTGALKQPEGAVVIDTSGLTLEEVVARILAALESPSSGGGNS